MNTSRWTVAIALAVCPLARAQFEAYSGPGVSTEVAATAAGLALRIDTLCWGPKWAWFGFEPQRRPESPSAFGLTATSAIGGTGVPVELTYAVASVGPQALTITYTVTVQTAAELTGIAAAVMPQEAFRGGNALATLEDGSTRELPIGFPLGCVGEGIRVRQLDLISAAGQTTRIVIAPPRLLAADGAARIWVAGTRLAANTPETTTLTLTLPAATAVLGKMEDVVVRNQTPEWFAYEVGKYGTPVDLSFLNKDAQGNWVPAGAHGFVKVDGERFVFADGTPVRFWGTNITAYAAVADAARAEQLAERVARLGCNLVRLHHLDSEWAPGIIDRQNPDNTTQNLNAENLRKLDRLVYELKRRGVYVILDPWVGRAYRAGDGVPGFEQMGGGNFGLHPYIFFNARMQALHKQYLKQVWSHTNEFTQLAYRDDPAVAMTELCNEALFDQSKLKLEPYRSEFLDLYRQWARANAADPDATESILTQNWPQPNQRFMQDLLKRFYADFLAYDRQLGLQMPINASNWSHWPWDLGTQLDASFMEAHHYYGGDRIGPGYGLGGLWVAHPPTLPNGPFGQIGQMNILGQPLNVSECGNNPPKTYRSSYFVGLAAVAALQDWGGIQGFAYSQGGQATDRLSDFEFEADPATVAAMAAGALIYRRADVRPAEKLAILAIEGDEMYAMHWQNGGEQAYQHSPQFQAMLETHRVRVVYGATPAAGAKADLMMNVAAAFAYKHPGTELRSDTGELWRNWQTAVGTVDTPRTQAAYGKLGALAAPLQTRGASFQISTPYAMVSLSSLSEQPIASSRQLLLTACARAENTGQATDKQLTRLIERGTAPIVVEPVVGTITFATSAPALRAYPIRADGQRGPATLLTIAAGQATLSLTAAGQTLFYEIE
jgi:hypothetical protein